VLLIELFPSLQKRKRTHHLQNRKPPMMAKLPEELQKRQESQLKKLERPLRKREKPMKRLLRHSGPSKTLVREPEMN
jgi:hypothetical protein